MASFLKNFSALVRFFSNTKNLLIICLAFFLSEANFIAANFIFGFLSLSFICSAVYAFNTLFDQKIDKLNENKSHYSGAVLYFGQKNVLLIIFVFLLLGFIFGFAVNYYFAASLIFLVAFGFLYSSPWTRFKEKPVLDILFSSFFTFAFRFISAWLIFSTSMPPLLPLFALGFSKSAGFMLYKENDRPALLKNNIKNSITAMNKKLNIIISTSLLLFSLLLTSLMCLNGKYFHINWWGYLPFNLIFLIPLGFLSIIVADLKVAGIINYSIRKLRIIGYLYAILVLVLAFLII